ncbi:MAG: ferritin-like domain-containing protein [Solirubrobacteraceae bacterium]
MSAAAALSRRGLLARAGAAGAAAAAGGLLLAGAADSPAQGIVDQSAVVGAVRLQQALAVAYTGMAARPAVGREVRALLTELADQERQHAAALLTLAEYLGDTPPPAPSFVEVEQALPKIRAVVDRPTALAVLDELERAEILGFYSDQQILGDVKLVQLVGAVMCSDSQHLVLVRQAAGLDPIPSPSETGNLR